MHRLFLSRALCNASFPSRPLGVRIGSSPQAWEVTVRLLWPSTRDSAQPYCSKGRPPPGEREALKSHCSYSEEPSSKAVSSGSASYHNIEMNSSSKSSGEMKSKRSREFVSPLRPSGSKRKADKLSSTANEPPIICLDDIPIPKVVPSSTKKKIPLDSKAKKAPLDFIPLPPSPPPPLPPPLPSPPPPPCHTEMDEVMNDFFIIDTTSSTTLFPVPLPPKYAGRHSEMTKNTGNGSSPAMVTVNDDSDPEEISMVYSSDSVLPDQFSNINLLDKSKSSSSQNDRQKSNDADHVDIVFEGQWPWVMKTPETHHSNKKKKKQLLDKRSVATEQVRNCHSTNHSFKTVDKSADLVDAAEPDIITLDSSIDNVLSRMSPENFINFNTENNASRDFISLNVQDTATFPDEDKELTSNEDKKRNKKSKKRKSKKHHKEMIDNSDTSPSKSERELSPGIQKVGIIDPDVVEIDDSFASSSRCVPVDMEVVDLSDSDTDGRSNLAVSSHTFVPEEAEDVNEEELSDSSNQGGASTSSKHNGPSVDISNSDFIALGEVNLNEVVNTTIDLDDEILERRERLENLRQWSTTGLGQEVFVHNKVRKTDVIFTLMSYNVLAQQLLLDNKYLYNECQAKHLDWKYRWALLQYEVEDLNPDILLLQEVQASHYYSHFLPWFNIKGYEGVYKKRTGEKCDGCAIFYRTNKFSMIEHCSVEYLQPKAKKVLDRDNIAIIAKLAPVGNPESAFCVATTHFLYNPKRHDVKLAQSVLLLAELDRLCYEGEKAGITQYSPLIVTGDFNSEPHSALLDLFKEGRLHYEGLSMKTLTQHGAYPALGSELIPQSLGITDRCQHAVLAQSRFVEKTTGQLFSLSDKRKIEQSLIRLNNSDLNHQRLKGVGSAVSGPPPTGWYSHNFNFKSVYRHFTKRSVEATTFHNKWTSVDYIMYSRIFSNSREPVEGSLKLLGRYGLLSGHEAKKFAPLPSAVCPSDHFPLAAQFMLRKK